MTSTEPVGGAVRRYSRPAGRGLAAVCSAVGRSSTTSSGPGWRTPCSSGVRTRVRAFDASTPPRRSRVPGVHAVFTAADLNPESTSSGTRRWARTCPTRRALRWQRRRPGSSGIQSRSSSLTDSYIAEDAIELWTSTTSRSRRWSTTCDAEALRGPCTSSIPGTSRAHSVVRLRGRAGCGVRLRLPMMFG